MAKYYVLVNPLSGNGASKSAVEKIQAFYKDDEVVIKDVTQIDDYGKFLEEIEADASVVVVGGDGTLNRFINAIPADYDAKKIYFFAAGSGNDFFHDIEGTEGEPVLINSYLKDLPTVTVNGKSYRFINGIGFGIDGYCCEVGDIERAKSDKPVNYTAIAIKGLLFHFKPTNATVTIDGVTHTYKRTWLVPTMHGRFYGGGMIPTPGQDRMNPEHQVSVLSYHNCGKLKALMVFPNIFKGEHVKHTEMCEVLRGKEVEVEFEKPCALQIDGETILNVKSYKVTTVTK